MACKPVLPDGIFQTKNVSLGTFWNALQRKMLVTFVDISSIFLQFGAFYDCHLVYFVVILVHFSRFEMF
jgi:hypothetical protein